MTLHTPSQDNRVVFTVPTNRPIGFVKRNSLGRSRVPSSAARCLKKNDPFLYFSKSRQRLNELRYSFGGSSEVENDSTERSFDGDNERKSRFSTEVHPTHDAMIADFKDDVYVLGDINDMLDRLDGVSI